MKNVWILSTSLTGILALSACSQSSSFDAAIQSKDMPATQDATPVDGGNAIPVIPVIQEKTENEPPVLVVNEGNVVSVASVVVQVPSESLRAGSQKIQAVATISGTSETDLVWSVQGPAGLVDPLKIGSIDARGLYTSPDDDSIGVAVTIIASLVSDPSISGSTSLQVVPEKQLFVGCTKGSAVFPITGEIYDGLDKNTVKRLPDFSTMVSNDKVCLDKFDIKRQAGIAGFLGQPTRQEWFGLHTVSTLIIPADGEYEFSLNSDDGSMMSLDGVTIIDNGAPHVMLEIRAKKTLKAGKYKMVLDWYQGNIGQLGLILSWRKPGMAADVFEVVPTTSFAAYVSAAK